MYLFSSPHFLTRNRYISTRRDIEKRLSPFLRDLEDFEGVAEKRVVSFRVDLSFNKRWYMGHEAAVFIFRELETTASHHTL